MIHVSWRMHSRQLTRESIRMDSRRSLFLSRYSTAARPGLLIMLIAWKLLHILYLFHFPNCICIGVCVCVCTCVCAVNTTIHSSSIGSICAPWRLRALHLWHSYNISFPHHNGRRAKWATAMYNRAILQFGIDPVDAMVERRTVSAIFTTWPYAQLTGSDCR